LAAAVKFIFDNVEESPMQAFDQRQGFDIEWSDLLNSLFAIDRPRGLGNDVHHYAFL
jgi:hypothetical protein